MWGKKPQIQSGRCLTCAAMTKYSLTGERIEGMIDPSLWNTSRKAWPKWYDASRPKSNLIGKSEGAPCSPSSHHLAHPAENARSKAARTQDRNVGTSHVLVWMVDRTRRFQPMPCGWRWSKKPMPGVMPRICWRRPCCMEDRTWVEWKIGKHQSIRTLM